MPSYAIRPEDRVPLRQKVCYASGAGLDPLVMGTVVVFIMVFYNGVLGVPATWVGLALLLPRVLDAITDPLVGRWSDRFTSRYGRRRPFMLLGGILVLVTYFFTWTPPGWVETDLAKVIYLGTMGVLLSCAVTLFRVPYEALGYELTPDYHERTNVMAVKKVLHSVGEALIGTMPVIAVWMALGLGRDGDERFGYSMAAAIYCVVVCVMVLLPTFGTKEPRARETGNELAFWKSLQATLRNRAFLLLTAAFVSQLMAIIILAQTMGYLVIYYLDRPDLSALFGIFGGVTGMLFSLLWRWVGNRTGKNIAILLAQGTMVVAALVYLTAFRPESPYVLFIYATIYFFAWTGVLVLVNAILADVIDLDELETGQRREGSYAGVFGFAYKIGVAGTAPLFGMAVDWVGFAPELGIDQAPGVFTGLRNVASLSATGCALFAFLMLWRFPLTRKRAAEIRLTLEQRRGKRGAVV